MRFRSFVLVLAAAGWLLSALGCADQVAERETESEPAPAATPLGSGLLQVSASRQQHIGVATRAAVRRPITNSLVATGWLMAKPGNEVQVKAAASGFVMTGNDDSHTVLGSVVADRQELGQLHIFLSPQEEAQLVALKEDADMLIEQSLASLAIAQDRYEKVKDIEGGVLAAKDLLTLREVVERSRVAVEQAREKLPFLPSEPYGQPLRLHDVAINSPLAGRIVATHVRPRQLVAAGDPLWTVADWSTLWVQIPVFEGDLPTIDSQQAIEVIIPGTDARLPARPTGIPQPTEAGRRTVNLLYEVVNDSWQLRPGQPVSANLPTAQSSEQLIVPQSAVLWDGLGNAWVYVRADVDTFRRQRVQVGASHNDGFTIERGLDENQQVVIVGAETLYGEEFKSQIELEDDD